LLLGSTALESSYSCPPSIKVEQTEYIATYTPTYEIGTLGTYDLVGIPSGSEPPDPSTPEVPGDSGGSGDNLEQVVRITTVGGGTSTIIDSQTAYGNGKSKYSLTSDVGLGVVKKLYLNTGSAYDFHSITSSTGELEFTHASDGGGDYVEFTVPTVSTRIKIIFEPKGIKSPRERTGSAAFSLPADDFTEHVKAFKENIYKDRSSIKSGIGTVEALDKLKARNIQVEKPDYYMGAMNSIVNNYKKTSGRLKSNLDHIDEFSNLGSIKNKRIK